MEDLTKNGKALILAYDHGLEHGTVDFNDDSVDPEKILKIADCGFFTGVILQKGIVEKYYQKDNHKVSLIVKLNGKTNLLEDEPYSPQICSVSEAVSLGAKAVAYTVYIGSSFEAKMTSELAKIEEDCREHSLPLIGFMYPRGKAVSGKENTKEILAYAARIGLELGVEYIKIPYNHDPESFSWVVKSAGRVGVFVLGGAKVEEEVFLKTAKEIMEIDGVAGMVVGRNIWQSKNPLVTAEKLSKIIFK